MYRDFPFSRLSDVLLHQMRWEWMLLSFIPGILAQVFRGLRWHQSLTPLGERPRVSHCIYAVFLSYAASLIIPRIGEFLRCGVLTRHDKTDFPKALGTVVTERAVDSVIVLLLVLCVFLSQIHVFLDFFDVTGMSLEGTLSRFTSTGILVTVVCVVGIIILLFVLFRRLKFMGKVRSVVHGLTEGLLSVKNVRNIPLYIVYSVGIWVAYFLHYYLTFYCFSFTENMGLTAGLVSFCVGTIAVIVPTPNGAGPWHFAVKTILVLYGLSASNAIMFALIVHSVQTLLLVLLGIYALVVLSFHSPLRRGQKV
jgi:uncharacterized protein (TIRG00374 family)